MKKTESDKLVAMIGRTLGCYLVTHSQTVEGIKEEIDAANANAVAKGYKPDVFTIICEETYTWFDDDGNFVKRETYESVVEVYPKA